MLAAIVTLLSYQAQTMPPEWNGVWATNQGQYVVINSTTSLQFMLGERHGSAVGVVPVPDGSCYGQWRGNRRMLLLPFNDPNKRHYEAAYGPLPKSPSLPFPQPAQTSADSGDVRISLGRADNAGRTQFLNFLLRDANGSKKLEGQLFPVTTLEGLSVHGSYADSTLAIDLKDQGGRSAGLSGTLSHLNVNYPLSGMRVEARGSFQLTHPNTGRPAGWGYVEWTPSPRRIGQMRSRDSNVTDQLTVFVYLADGSLPTGAERILVRK